MTFILNILKSFGVGLVKNIILKPLTTVTSIVFMWGFNALVKASPGRAAYIADKITKTYFDMTTPWAQFVSSYAETLTGKKIPVESIVGGTIGAASSAATGAFVKEFFNDMLNLVLPSPEELKANPLIGGEKFLSANLKFQMDAWWLHVLGDMMSFGIFKSLKDLPNAISWSFGIGWLSWLVMGGPFRIGIAGPMERHFNKIYTPERLTIAQLIDATQKGFIDAEDYINRMKEAGFSSDLSTILYELGRKELSRSELQKLYELKMLSEEDLKGELLKMGYPENIASTLEYLMANDRWYDLRSKVATEILELYSDKKLTDTELGRYYGEFGYNEKEIEMVKLLGRLRMDTKPKLTLSEQTSLFRTRIIGYTDILEALTSQGYSIGEAIRYVLAHVPKDEWDGLIPAQWFDMIFK